MFVAYHLVQFFMSKFLMMHLLLTLCIPHAPILAFHFFFFSDNKQSEYARSIEKTYTYLNEHPFCISNFTIFFEHDALAKYQRK